MGSAEGRRKCCVSFFAAGYETVCQKFDHKLNDRFHRYDDMVINPEPDENDMYACNTGSLSFRGLFRMGWRMAYDDCVSGRKRRKMSEMYANRHEYAKSIKAPREAK